MGTPKTILIQVKPNSPTSALSESDDGSPWLARLKSPPVEGKANRELIALVAQHFHCAKSAVSIKRGIAGRLKQVEIRQG
ncbi:MAG: DUF167 domain-containing protein [Gammaproteobacteria bacterium]